MISDDIHRAREEKRRSMLLEPRGQCVGAAAADADVEQSINHSETMKNIRKMTLDNIDIDDIDLPSDSESTDSEEPANDDYLQTDTRFENSDYANTSGENGGRGNKLAADIPIVITQTDATTSSPHQYLVNNNNDNNDILEKQTEKTIKEISEKVDASYDVITSCSILLTPLPVEILPEFDITDSGKQIIKQLRESKRARSYTDLSRTGQQKIIDISKKSPMNDVVDDENGSLRDRSSTVPTNVLERTRRWSSFSAGFDSKDSPTPGTPDTMKKAIERVAALTLTPLKDLDTSRDIEHSL